MDSNVFIKMVKKQIKLRWSHKRGKAVSINIKLELADYANGVQVCFGIRVIKCLIVKHCLTTILTVALRLWQG